jgi:hypothetical protein
MAVEQLIVYQKAFDFFVWQKSVTGHLAKVHKYSLGVRIENESLELLKNIVVANMARSEKLKAIEHCKVPDIKCQLSNKFQTLRLSTLKHLFYLIILA